MRRRAIAIFSVAALTLSMLSACSSGGGDIDLSGIPLTEEERLNSTYNPIYMGADVDRNGNELVVGTGENGQVANQEMIDHHEQFEPKMYKITDRVYMTNSYGLANSVMIEGDNGIIIVDTNDSIEAAQMELEQFRTVTDSRSAL